MYNSTLHIITYTWRGPVVWCCSCRYIYICIVYSYNVWTIGGTREEETDRDGARARGWEKRVYPDRQSCTSTTLYFSLLRTVGGKLIAHCCYYNSNDIGETTNGPEHVGMSLRGDGVSWSFIVMRSPTRRSKRAPALAMFSRCTRRDAILYYDTMIVYDIFRKWSW